MGDRFVCSRQVHRVGGHGEGCAFCGRTAAGEGQAIRTCPCLKLHAGFRRVCRDRHVLARGILAAARTVCDGHSIFFEEQEFDRAESQTRKSQFWIVGQGIRTCAAGSFIGISVDCHIRIAVIVEIIFKGQSGIIGMQYLILAVGIAVYLVDNVPFHVWVIFRIGQVKGFFLLALVFGGHSDILGRHLEEPFIRRPSSFQRHLIGNHSGAIFSLGDAAGVSIDINCISHLRLLDLLPIPLEFCRAAGHCNGVGICRPGAGKLHVIVGHGECIVCIHRHSSAVCFGFSAPPAERVTGQGRRGGNILTGAVIDNCDSRHRRRAGRRRGGISIGYRIKPDTPLRIKRQISSQ